MCVGAVGFFIYVLICCLIFRFGLRFLVLVVFVVCGWVFVGLLCCVFLYFCVFFLVVFVVFVVLLLLLGWVGILFFFYLWNVWGVLCVFGAWYLCLFEACVFCFLY